MKEEKELSLNLQTQNNKNIGVILGMPGSGKAFHPWDNLKTCPDCGRDSAWMVGKDGKDYNSGAPYQIICTNEKCNYKSVSSDDIQTCKDDWNNEKNK